MSDDSYREHPASHASRTELVDSVRPEASWEIERSRARRAEQTAPPGGGVIGSRARKVDGAAKATGRAVYADDIQLPGMLHAKLVRSPHPHARIRGIDVSAAMALEGVHAVLTGADLPATFGIIPWTHDETALATDKVLFVGDPVACVAAVDEETANLAVKRVTVDYELLEPILDAQEALRRSDHVLNPHARSGNVTKHVELEFGDVDAALAAADRVVEQEYSYAGSTHAAIEPHCAIASWEPAGREGEGQLTVWSSTQIPHYLHRELSRVLELPQARVRVIQPALGGGFGGKSDPFGFEICVAKLAMITGRPVKILLTREEVFYTHRGRHPFLMRVAVGAELDGRITGVRSRLLLDGGAYASYGLVTTYYAGQLLTGPYDLPAYAFDATRVYTNKPPCGPKRGHGSVQPRFALEVALDELAAELGVDPIALRRKNDQGEVVATVNGQRVTSNGFDLCLDAVEKASSWRARRGKLPFGHGLGVAGSMYISGTNYPIYPNMMPMSAVQLKVDRSGKVTVFTGASDIGQGSDSVVAYIVCEELGCELGDVRVVAADTDLCPVDLGAYSSRVTFMVGSACIDASRKLRTQVQEAVGAVWNLPPRQIGLAGGRAFDVGDTSRTLPLAEAFQLAESRSGALGAVGHYNSPKLGGDYRGGTIGASPAYSFTAHVAQVKVDAETGFIDVERIWIAHDCGRALNPTLVEGQMEGSAYMGFAEAIMEEQLFHDEGPQAGLLCGPSLLDYRIPTIADTPELQALIVESYDPEGPYGAKEAGEGPLHPSIPAIANAVYDAVGIRLRRLPFYPSEVLRLLGEKGVAAAASGAV
jgi:4-hydroxybenzoyl-CoA reductase alpha subunit